jgi:hypothetical protein
MSIYAATATRTLATIKKKGAPVVFDGAGTPATYDPLTDLWSGGSPAQATGSAVQVPGDPDQFRALSLVLVNPVTLLVAASGLAIVPVPGNTFTWAGTKYTVRHSEPVAPDGVPILHTVIGDV